MCEILATYDFQKYEDEIICWTYTQIQKYQTNFHNDRKLTKPVNAHIQ